jgi:Ca2+-binding RTX toxin-like protein
MAIRYATGTNLNGTSGDDYLYGNGSSNVIRGFEGSDWIYGYGGSDTLYGGPNNDYLFGGDGADRLYGEAGNDRLTGGKGADWHYFLRDGGKDTVTDLNPSELDRVILGSGVNVQSYQEYNPDGDANVEWTRVYLAYEGDTSGKPPDYLTFLYASQADVSSRLFEL